MIKQKGLENPGPGHYETDTYPMNHKNLAYPMGIDVRKPLGAKDAHMYPGPGEYELHEHQT